MFIYLTSVLDAFAIIFLYFIWYFMLSF